MDGEDASEEEDYMVENPIVDNRIVNDQTFATRFKRILTLFKPTTQWDEEELEYMNIVADKLLAYQKATLLNKSEKDYFKNLEK